MGSLVSEAQCAHRAAVHAALWEASAQHATADLHRVEAAAGLLTEEAHGRLLQLPRHGACRQDGLGGSFLMPRDPQP